MICVSRAARTMNNFSYAHGVTVTVRSLRAQNSGSEVVVGVLLENGEQREQRNLPLTMEQYCELKPARGQISEEQYEQLEEASTLCMALRCGEHLLSYGANSVQTLTQKLMRHGYTKDVSRRAAMKLEESGLIDEERDLGREVEKCLRKHWGSRRIQAHLWGRGFSREAMAGLPPLLEGVDFPAHCAALIRKHYGEVPEDANDRRRMVASLGRYGYTITEIRAALQLVQRVTNEI